jgi:hypothetical protein
MRDASDVVDILLAIMGEEHQSALVILDGADASAAEVEQEYHRRARRRRCKTRVRRA